MSKLLDKVRALTPQERRELAKEGLYLLGNIAGREEEAIYRVLDIVLTKKEVADISDFDEEKDLFNAVVNVTYGIEVEDSKN